MKEELMAYITVSDNCILLLIVTSICMLKPSQRFHR